MSFDLDDLKDKYRIKSQIWLTFKPYHFKKHEKLHSPIWYLVLKAIHSEFARMPRFEEGIVQLLYNPLERQIIDEIVTSDVYKGIIKAMFERVYINSNKIWNPNISNVRVVTQQDVNMRLQEPIKLSKIPLFAPLENEETTYTERVYKAYQRISNLLFTLILSLKLRNRQDGDTRKLRDFRLKNPVFVFPKMQVKKKPLMEISELTTHREMTKVYFGRHFGVFSTIFFGLLGFCLKRGQGLPKRFYRLTLFYLGALDPCLWPKLMQRGKPLMVVNPDVTKPVPFDETFEEEEIDFYEEIAIFRPQVQPLNQLPNYPEILDETNDETYIAPPVTGQREPSYNDEQVNLIENELVNFESMIINFPHLLQHWITNLLPLGAEFVRTLNLAKRSRRQEDIIKCYRVVGELDKKILIYRKFYFFVRNKNGSLIRQTPQDTLRAYLDYRKKELQFIWGKWKKLHDDLMIDWEKNQEIPIGRIIAIIKHRLKNLNEVLSKLWVIYHKPSLYNDTTEFERFISDNQNLVKMEEYNTANFGVEYRMVQKMIADVLQQYTWTWVRVFMEEIPKQEEVYKEKINNFNERLTDFLVDVLSKIEDFEDLIKRVNELSAHFYVAEDKITEKYGSGEEDLLNQLTVKLQRLSDFIAELGEMKFGFNNLKDTIRILSREVETYKEGGGPSIAQKIEKLDGFIGRARILVRQWDSEMGKIEIKQREAEDLETFLAYVNNSLIGQKFEKFKEPKYRRGGILVNERTKIDKIDEWVSDKADEVRTRWERHKMGINAKIEEITAAVIERGGGKDIGVTNDERNEVKKLIDIAIRECISKSQDEIIEEVEIEKLTAELLNITEDTPKVGQRVVEFISDEEFEEVTEESMPTLEVEEVEASDVFIEEEGEIQQLHSEQVEIQEKPSREKPTQAPKSQPPTAANHDSVTEVHAKCLKVFSKWVNNRDLHEDVELRIEEYQKFFIQTIDFHVDAKETIYNYSHMRNRYDKCFKKTVKSYWKSPYHQRHAGVVDFAEPLINHYLNSDNTEAPRTQKEKLLQMQEGFIYYDIHLATSSLFTLLKTNYDYSEKPKRGSSDPKEQSFKEFGVEFEPLREIIKEHLPVFEGREVARDWRNIITHMTHLGELKNLGKILHCLYELIKAGSWRFVDKTKFDERFDKYFVEDDIVTKVIIMICNIRDPFLVKKHLLGGGGDHVPVLVQLKSKEHILSAYGGRRNNGNWVIDDPDTEENREGAVYGFCYEVMKVIYPFCEFNTVPKTYNYFAYLAVQSILKWFIREVFERLDLWKEYMDDMAVDDPPEVPGEFQQLPQVQIQDLRRQLEYNQRHILDLQNQLQEQGNVLRVTREGFDDQMREFRDEEGRLNQLINDLQRKFIGSEKANQNLNQRNIGLDNKFQSCFERLRQLSTNHMNLQQKFNGISEVNRNLDQQNIGLKENLRKCNDELDKLNQLLPELKKTQGENQQLEDNVNKCNELVTNLNNHLKELEQKIKNSNIENQKLRDLNTKYKDSLNKYLNTLKGLKVEFIKLKQELNDTQKQNKALRDKNIELNNVLQIHLDEIKKLTNEIKKYESELKECLRTVRHLKRRIIPIKEKNKKQFKEIIERIKDFSDVKAENDILKKRLEECEELLKSKKVEPGEDLKKKLKKCLKKLRIKDAKIADLKRQLDECLEKLKIKDVEIARLQSLLDECLENQKNIKLKLSEEEKKFETCRDDYHKKDDDENKKLKVRIEQLEKEKNVLEIQIGQWAEEWRRDQEELQRIRIKIKELKEMVEIQIPNQITEWKEEIKIKVEEESTVRETKIKELLEELKKRREVEHTEAIKNLKEENKILVREREKAKIELAEIKEKNVTIKDEEIAKIKEMERKRGEVESRIKVLEKKNKKLEKEYQFAVGERDKAKIDLKKGVTIKDAKVEELVNEIKLKEDLLNQMDIKLKEWMVEHDKLEDKIKIMVDPVDVKKLQVQIEELKKEKNKINTNFEDWKRTRIKEIKSKESKIEKLKKQIGIQEDKWKLHLKNLLKREKTLITEKQNEIIELSVQLKDTAKDLEIIKQTLFEAEQSNAGLEFKKRDLISQRDDLKNKLNEKDSEVIQKKLKYEKLIQNVEQQKNQLQQRINQLLIKEDNLKKVETIEKQNREILQKEYNEYIEKLKNEMNEKVVNAEHWQNEYRKQNELDIENLKTKESNIIKLERQINELKRKIEKLEEQKSETTKKLEIYKRVYEEQNLINVDQEVLLRLKESEIVQRNAEIKQKNSEIVQTNSEIVQAKLELFEKEKNVQELIETIQELRVQQRMPIPVPQTIPIIKTRERRIETSERERINARIKELKEKLRKKEKEIDDAASERLKQFRDHINVVNRLKTQYSAKITELREEQGLKKGASIQYIRSRETDLRGKVKEKEAIIKKIQEEVKEKEATIKKIQEKLKEKEILAKRKRGEIEPVVDPSERIITQEIHQQRIQQIQQQQQHQQVQQLQQIQYQIQQLQQQQPQQLQQLQLIQQHITHQIDQIPDDPSVEPSQKRHKPNQPPTSARFFEDFEPVCVRRRPEEACREISIVDSYDFCKFFPKHLNWNYGKIDIYVFGSRMLYSDEALNFTRSFMLFQTLGPMRRAVTSRKNGALYFPKLQKFYPIQVDKALTLKQGKESIFTTKEKAKLRKNIKIMLTYLIRYEKLCKRNQPSLVLKKVLSKLIRWSLNFSMRFLDYNLSGIKSALLSGGRELYTTDESFRTFMMGIRNHLNQIWQVIFATLKRVNVNNRHFYHVLISILFDSKKLNKYSEGQENIYGEMSTDIIAHILAIRNMEIKSRYWLINPRVVGQLLVFERYHGNGRKFSNRLRTSTNFLTSSAFLLGVPPTAYKPTQFVPLGMKGLAFDYYRIHLLPRMGFYDVTDIITYRPTRLPVTANREMLNELKTLEDTAFIDV